MLPQVFVRQDANICLRYRRSLLRVARSTAPNPYQHALLRSRPLTSESSLSKAPIDLPGNVDDPKYGGVLVPSEGEGRNDRETACISFRPTNDGFLERRPPKNRPPSERARHNGRGMLYDQLEASRHKSSLREFQLDAETVVLDHPVLGHPAQIRILRDEKRQSRSDRVEALVLDQEQPTSADLIRTVTEEEVTSGEPTQVFQNIDDLRNSLRLASGIEGFPTLPQCQEVARQLYDGFTHVQLTEYLGRRDDNTHNADYLDMTRSFSTKQYTRSAWNYQTSEFPNPSFGSRIWPNVSPSKASLITQGIQSGRPSQKQLSVEEIFRKSWHVIAEEERRLEGEVDIRIPQEDLDLLLNHKTDVFKGLAQQYGAKIEVSKKVSFVRLTADYTTCCDLLKMIHYALENIRIGSVEIEPSAETPTEARKSSIDIASVKQLEKMTSTVITPAQQRPLEHSTKFQVRYLGPQTTDLDDVRRLLTQSMELKLFKHSKALCVYRSDVMPLKTPVDVRDSLPWVERAIPWIRWGYPLQKAKSRPGDRDTDWRGVNMGDSGTLVSEEQTRTVITEILQREAWVIDEVVKFLFEESQSSSKVTLQSPDTYWFDAGNRRLEAALGLVVYPEKDPEGLRKGGKRSKVTKARFQSSLNTPRALIPGRVVDRLPYLEHMSLLGGSHQVRDYIFIRLRPSASDDLSRTSSLPELELHVLVNHQERRVDLHTARLCFQEKEVDLLLPEETADVRFRSFSYFKSRPESMDPALLDYVQRSNFDIWGTDRLTAAPRLQLRVPGFATRPFLASHLNSNNDDIIAEDIVCQYVFTSMEHKSRMSLKYQNAAVNYSTIEAGISGGRRDELTLGFDPRRKGVDLANKFPNLADGFPDFYMTVRQFLVEKGRKSDTSALDADQGTMSESAESKSIQEGRQHKFSHEYRRPVSYHYA